MKTACIEGNVIVRPMTARIGAEIEGVDLTCSLELKTVKEIRDALLRYQVIFFRD